MSEFLGELYVARTDAASVERAAERVRLAAEELSREGTPVRFVRTIFVPDDETCFYLFEAVSASAVREVAARAALRFEHLSRSLPHRKQTDSSAPSS